MSGGSGPEPGRPPRVLRDVKLQWLSLDLEPGPYGSIPQVVHPAVHRLKTWPPYFEHVRAGVKTFDVRPDDRDFRPGDRVILERFDPAATFQQAQELEAEITYVLPGGQLGIEPGFCVLGLRLLAAP